MNDNTAAELEPPRQVTAKAMTITGLVERYAMGALGGIASQWRQRLGPHLGVVPGQVGSAAYGVMFGQREEGGKPTFQYLAGVEVADTANLPDGFTVVRLPAQTYAVFTHRGHVSTVQSTMDAIMRAWMPTSGYSPADMPTFFERYGAEFDPVTGLGGFEVWMPVKDGEQA
jgi:AraC family transcriptional regulator